MSWLNTDLDFQVLLEHEFDHVTLADQAAAPTPDANQIDIYTKDSSGYSLPWSVDDNGVSVNIAHDSVMVARNTSGGALTKGTLVYITGSTGNVPNFSAAQANDHDTHADAVLLEDVANNGFGLVAHRAMVTVDTSSVNEGDAVWLSASVAGAWTTTEPTSASGVYIQEVGIVTKKAVAGIIHFDIQSAPHSEHIWHGDVGGLDQDDHTQYVLVDGSRDMTGTLIITDPGNNEGLTIDNTGAAISKIELDSNRANNDESLSVIETLWNGTAVSRIVGLTGTDDTNKDDGYLAFYTGESGVLSECLRVRQDKVIGTVGSVYIGGLGSSVPSNVTQGLCIDGGGSDNEHILFINDDVEHGMTSRVPTNAFLRIRKGDSATGGGYIEGLGSGNEGLKLQGSITTGETSLADTTYAPFRLSGSLKTGTTSGAFPSGYNIGCFVNHSTVVWKCQSHGLVWQSGPLLINDTACTDITTGICVNQGAADDYNIVGKSSDVDHNLAQYLEEDSYYGLKKCHATYGGLHIMSIMEDQNYAPAMEIISAGGQASTTKSTAGRALMEFVVTEHDNANTRTDITADGNCYGWRARKSGAFVSVMLLDEDGDTWQSGGAEFGGHLKSNLSVSTNGLELIQTGSNRIDIEGDANRTNTDDIILRIKGEWNGTEVANMNFRAGTDTTNKDDGYIDFFTATGGSLSNQMKITETGGIFMYNLKSGATAAAASAGTNELWVTASHASLPDGVVMMG